MNFRRLKIPDIILCEPQLHRDNRGYFCETFRKDKLEKFLGYEVNFCQENESKSTHGVLRGLHYQLPPHAQTKLVKVLHGSILDIAIDLRKDSAHFGKHVSVELNAVDNNLLFIPRGFAHGFVVLSDEAYISYKSDNYYNSKFERGISFNDKSLGINWRLKNEKIQLSDKDSSLPVFNNAEFFESSHKL